jgi:DNA-binding LytR/AlgR family response regulator
MKVLIVEDETAAYDNLVNILNEIDPEIEVLGNTESVKQTVLWLTSKTEPDLILLDIHLSDGSAFNIFSTITVDTPIIFTTAYDDYAINAFKVNSIDYLLKPINVEELKVALEKFKKWGKQDIGKYYDNLNRLIASDKYAERILVPLNDKLLPISLSDVSFFYTSDNKTTVMLKNGKSYPYARRLDDINNTLDPTTFYRVNKQFIIAKDSIKEIVVWFDNRLLIRLDTDTPETIYVPKNKASEFKKWMV